MRFARKPAKRCERAVALALRNGICHPPPFKWPPVKRPSLNLPTGGSDWSCFYQPTMNYDWHDDVVCSNTRDQQRPYLREWDDYITQVEIMESAREYERQLNNS